jgi:protein-L-isoaspartate(D-aspartate) O-methyltransferase
LVAPDGIVIGVDHIQGLVDMATNNMGKSKGGQALLESKRVQFIKADGRLGYKEGGTGLYFKSREGRDRIIPTLVYS